MCLAGFSLLSEVTDERSLQNEDQTSYGLVLIRSREGLEVEKPRTILILSG